MVSEVGETTDEALDDVFIEVEEGLEDRLSATPCRLLARHLRRKRRSCSNSFCDFQVLGRNSGSFSN